MAIELLSFSAYARRRGCDEKAVRKAVAQERITAIERDGKRFIDPAVADIQWAQNTRPRVRPNAPRADQLGAPGAAGAAVADGAAGGLHGTANGTAGANGLTGSTGINPAIGLGIGAAGGHLAVMPGHPGHLGQHGPVPDPTGHGYTDHKARQARADAERAEIEVARLAGRVLDRERAERAAFDAFRELRDASFAAMKSAARQVIGMTEVRDVEITLEDAIRQAFGEWDERMRQRIVEQGGTRP